jgi:GNAT superfamily N-acetyltransferase
LHGGQTVLFYCDLSGVGSSSQAIMNGFRVETRGAVKDFPDSELRQLVEAWNPEVARKQINERFERGARVWIVLETARVVAYGWTNVGSTIEPHFLPLGPNDVHLFDFMVLPEYRGRGINPALVQYILSCLAQERRGRAYIEAADWNSPQLVSLRKTSFVRLGVARKAHLFGKALVLWR